MNVELERRTLGKRDESITRGAILSDKTKEKLQEAVVTVDVIIPAFNKGGCIEGVLHDIVMARQDYGFHIQNIYVISDASTDQTDDVVQQVAARDRRVKLLRKPERKGSRASRSGLRGLRLSQA